MSSRFLFLLMALAGLSFTGDRASRVDAFNGQTKKSVLRLQLEDYPRQMAELHAHGFDIAGVNFRAKQVDVVVNEVERRFIANQGYHAVATIMVDAAARPDPRYLNPGTVESTLREIHQQYPALTELISIGKSGEGRDIWALKLGNPQIQAPLGKPAVFINGMHHAREVMTPEIPVDVARYLLGGYGVDPKATHWIDQNEIWLIPMINVDGNNKMWTQDPWWRKNTRDGHGVDINRNYPYAWNTCQGSSSSPTAEDYRGTSAGSEPETQSVMAFVQRIRPVFSLSLHSYSEVVLYPYGCRGQFTPTHEVVESIGRQMAALLPGDDFSKQPYEAGTPPELLYSVDGGDIDWMYHEAQVIPYVIEVNNSGQGFQPDYDTWRDPTVLKMRPAWMLLLDRLDGPGLRGRLTGPDGGVPTGATVSAYRSGRKVFEQTNRILADGIFHLILPPGQYTVTYAAPGLSPRITFVTIGEQRTDLNVTLQP